MYAPLYLKTHNSLLSSMIQIDELINKAKSLNINALTITDNNMYGVDYFYHACISNNIKPIIGLEVEIDKKCIVLYARNHNGYKNLMKLTTIMSGEELNIDILKEYSSDLICIIPFTSKNLIDNIKDMFEFCFIGYKNKHEREQLNGGNLVYLNEILCLDKTDQNYLKCLYAIKEGITIDKVFLDKDNNYLLSEEELSNIYPFDIENNKKIVSLCNFEMHYYNDLLPVYQTNSDSFTYLKQLCKEGLKKIFGEKVNKVYIDRLKYELEIINKMGFCNYFLVVWDYVKYAKQNGILVGPGRGSAAGSLVSFCLNITTIDPIKYNLLFERFLNPERVTMPDIDIDFEYNRREEVINYCISKYGEKRVAPIITFGTLGAKQALRDVGRALDVNLTKIDSLCKLVDSRLTLKDNFNQNDKLRTMLSINSDLNKIYKIALKFEGLKRHTSIHAAGIVMSKFDLDEIIPLDKNHDDFYTTGYSMEYLEKIGLLKMDFLALRNLTLINDVLKEVDDVDFDNIPLNDKKALKIFYDVNTLGIFQFESTGMMNFLRKFKPTSFEDIVAAIALFRPGPMNNIDSYIKRKQGLEKIDYIDDSLVNILKPTYGIIVYQEQIMQIANVMANYSLGEADVLRRAMSKKKESILLSEKDKFISQSIDNGYTKEIATKVYELILKFASYGFNRSHSVAYAMIAYKMAYLKAYYPNIFIKNLLSMVIGSEIKTKEYIYEAKKIDINILPPCINRSNKDYSIEGKNIRYPLANIKNIGISAVTTIIDARNEQKFIDIFDFIKRCYGKSINRKTIESLIYAGCLDSFGYNRNTLINNLDSLINYGEIGSLLEDDESLRPVITEYKEFSKKELMIKELEMFGFYLSNHPVTEYRLKNNINISLSEIENYFDKMIKLIVYVDRIKEVNTKNNKKMVFITGIDEVSSTDFVLFPKQLEKYNDVKVGDIINVFGKVEKRFDKYQIVVNELKILE